jgi:hypothetical protein
MSEWLTTGQMIDRLKVGEVAESEDGKLQVYFEEPFKILKRKYINTGDTRLFEVWDSNRKRKWRILPRYVSFEEAMKAFEKGKKVYFHGVGDYKLDEGVELPPKGMNISNSLLKEWNPYSLYIGKWTIED